MFTIDRLIQKTGAILSALLASLTLIILIDLAVHSTAVWHAFGLHFITLDVWDPAKQRFGALHAILGTLISSGIAIALSYPVSFGIASFATIKKYPSIKTITAMSLKAFASIPSVILGMWGMFILAPFLALHVEPLLIPIFRPIPLVGHLFTGYPLGIGLLTASLILAIMIIPLQANMMFDLMSRVPKPMSESAYALGATHQEVICKIKRRYVLTGFLGSAILGLARALGETMAVTFVIGNAHTGSISLLEPSTTIAATIANEFSEASGPLYSHALIALGFLLMLITIITISLARWLVSKKNP